MKDELLALPMSDEVWIAGTHMLASPAKDDEPEKTMWLLVIQSRSRHFVLAHFISPEQPDAQTLLSTLIEAMMEPAQGEACRPTAVEKGPNLDWEPVEPMLEDIGIGVRPADTLGDLNTVFQYLSMQITGEPIPDLPIGDD